MNSVLFIQSITLYINTYTLISLYPFLCTHIHINFFCIHCSSIKIVTRSAERSEALMKPSPNEGLRFINIIIIYTNKLLQFFENIERDFFYCLLGI